MHGTYGALPSPPMCPLVMTFIGFIAMIFVLNRGAPRASLVAALEAYVHRARA